MEGDSRPYGGSRDRHNNRGGWNKPYVGHKRPWDDNQGDDRSRPPFDRRDAGPPHLSREYSRGRGGGSGYRHHGGYDDRRSSERARGGGGGGERLLPPSHYSSYGEPNATLSRPRDGGWSPPRGRDGDRSTSRDRPVDGSSHHHHHHHHQDRHRHHSGSPGKHDRDHSIRDRDRDRHRDTATASSPPRFNGSSVPRHVHHSQHGDRVLGVESPRRHKDHSYSPVPRDSSRVQKQYTSNTDNGNHQLPHGREESSPFEEGEALLDNGREAGLGGSGGMDQDRPTGDVLVEGEAFSPMSSAELPQELSPGEIVSSLDQQQHANGKHEQQQQQQQHGNGGEQGHVQPSSLPLPGFQQEEVDATLAAALAQSKQVVQQQMKDVDKEVAHPIRNEAAKTKTVSATSPPTVPVAVSISSEVVLQNIQAVDTDVTALEQRLKDIAAEVARLELAEARAAKQLAKVEEVPAPKPPSPAGDAVSDDVPLSSDTDQDDGDAGENDDDDDDENYEAASGRSSKLRGGDIDNKAGLKRRGRPPGKSKAARERAEAERRAAVPPNRRGLMLHIGKQVSELAGDSTEMLLKEAREKAAQAHARFEKLIPNELLEPFSSIFIDAAPPQPRDGDDIEMAEVKESGDQDQGNGVASAVNAMHIDDEDNNVKNTPVLLVPKAAGVPEKLKSIMNALAENPPPVPAGVYHVLRLEFASRLQRHVISAVDYRTKYEIHKKTMQAHEKRLQQQQHLHLQQQQKEQSQQHGSSGDQMRRTGSGKDRAEMPMSPTVGRSGSRGRNADVVRSDYEEKQAIATLQLIELVKKMMNLPVQKIQSPREARWVGQYVDRSRLVEDPEAEEDERVFIRPFTAEERTIFAEKFLQHHKDFHKIVPALPGRTYQEVVALYYAVQKSEEFELTRRKYNMKKRREKADAAATQRKDGALKNMVSIATYIPTTGSAPPHGSSAGTTTYSGLDPSAAAAGGGGVSAGGSALGSEGGRALLPKSQSGTSLGKATSRGRKQQQVVIVEIVPVNPSPPAAHPQGKRSLNRVATTDLESRKSILPSNDWEAQLDLIIGRKAEDEDYDDDEMVNVRDDDSDEDFRLDGEKSDDYRPQGHRRGAAGGHSRAMSSKDAAQLDDLTTGAAASGGNASTKSGRQRTIDPNIDGLFCEAVRLYGRNIPAIARHLGGAKTVAATRIYFTRHRERLGLDGIVAEFESTRAGMGVEYTFDEDAQMLGGGGVYDGVGGNGKSEYLSTEAWQGLWSEVQKEQKQRLQTLTRGPSVAAGNGAPLSMFISKSSTEMAEAVSTEEPATTAAGTTLDGQQQQQQEEGVVKGNKRDVAAVEASLKSALIAVPLEERQKLHNLLQPGGALYSEATAPEAEALALLMMTTSASSGAADAGQVAELNKTDIEIPAAAGAAVVATGVHAETKQEEDPGPADNNNQNDSNADVNTNKELPETVELNHHQQQHQQHKSEGSLVSLVPFLYTILAQCMVRPSSRSGKGGGKRGASSYWTKEEKDAFVECFTAHGRDWVKLEAFIPTKTTTQIKNYYQNYRIKFGLPKTGRGGGAASVSASASSQRGRKRRTPSEHGTSAKRGANGSSLAPGVVASSPAEQAAALQRMFLAGSLPPGVLPPLPPLAPGATAAAAAAAQLLQQQQQQMMLQQMVAAAGMPPMLGGGAGSALPGISPLQQLQAMMLMSGQAMAAAQQAAALATGGNGNGISTMNGVTNPESPTEIVDHPDTQQQQTVEEGHQQQQPMEDDNNTTFVKAAAAPDVAVNADNPGDISKPVLEEVPSLVWDAQQDEQQNQPPSSAVGTDGDDGDGEDVIVTVASGDDEGIVTQEQHQQQQLQEEV